MTNINTDWSDLLALYERMERPWNITPPKSVERSPMTRSVPGMAGGGDKPLANEAQALNVAREMEPMFIYIPELGWHRWDGNVWKEDVEGRSAFAVRHFVRNVDDCALWSFSQANGWNKRQTDLANTDSVYRALKTDPRLVASVTDFDTDAYSLNTPGGLYDLTTGRVMDVQRPLVLKSTTVAPEAGETPLWNKVLTDAFPGDLETQRYIESVLSLALFGNQDVQQFWMLSGESGSGKGTILNTVMELLGVGNTGYAMTVEMEFLMQQKGNQHSEQYARLYGKRMVVAQEAEETGATFSAARVKNLTGGDIITGRYMRGNSFSFPATWSLYMATNFRPSVSFDDTGFWRRFREIPFRSAPTGEVIANLKQRLISEEGPQILHRLIQRAQEYMAMGIGTPDAVRGATVDNRAEQDSLQSFIESECDTGSDLSVSTSEFYKAYKQWCLDNDRDRLTSTAVGKEIQRLGFTRGKSGNTRNYKGLNLSEQYLGF